MKNNHIKPLILLCIICILLTFAGCSQHDKYQPSLYTKEEVRNLFQENTELFEEVVKIVSSNETFYEEGRIHEYTDADITSPQDQELTLFSDEDRKIFDEIFEWKPYMILYDYARRFVSFTFSGADSHESYTLLFWTLNSDSSEDKFDSHKEFLEQTYIVETISDKCILYYYRNEGESLPIDVSIYQVKLAMGTEVDVFKETVEILDIGESSKEKLATPQKKEVQLGNKTVEANLIAVETYQHRGKHEILQSEDGKLKYIVDTTSHSFRVVPNSEFLAEFDGTALSEEAFVTFVKAYIATYVGDVDYEAYVYSCETSMVTTTDKSSWSETKSGFYLPSENETVTRYEVEFQTYVNGIKTADTIQVICDGNGDSTGFYYYEYDVAWEEVKVDQSKVDESISAFLMKNKKSKYQVSDYEIQSQVLTLVDGKIQLRVTAEIVLHTEDYDFEMLCPLIIDVGEL